jgi:hypothetical protein
MPTVILDTDFLSSFLKIGRCDLICLLYQIEQATIPTAVHRELARTTLLPQLLAVPWISVTTVNPSKAYPQVFHPQYHADQTEFYLSHGFSVHRVETVFRAPNRAVLEQVFRMDYPHAWRELLQGVHSLELSYGIAVFCGAKEHG